MNTTYSIKGIRPLIMSNGRVADPLNEYARELKKFTGKKTKTENDHIEIGRLEFDAALYFSKEIGLYIPAAALQKMLLEAAKKIKKGREICLVQVIDAPGAALHTPGHKSLDALRADASIHFRACTVQSGRKIAKVRPMFPAGWTLKFTVEFEPEDFDPDQLRETVEIAGRKVGLGNWRPSSPKCPGSFGKFIVESSEEVKP